MSIIKPSFESSLKVINEEIAKRRFKWKLTAIAWMSFEDIEQKLRLHIYNKWDKWDSSRPLVPWLNSVINNQIINIVRNNYSNHARPCLKCPFNGGDFSCLKYGQQSNECPEYAYWEKSKKSAFDVKLPISISDERFFGEGNSFEIVASTSNSFDYDSSIIKLHGIMKSQLFPEEWKIYEFLYIKFFSENETLKELGYTELTMPTGIKQIKKIISIIKKKVRTAIKEVV